MIGQEAQLANPVIRGSVDVTFARWLSPYEKPLHWWISFWDIDDQRILQSSEMLTLSWRRPLSYRNQPIDLQRKSMDWFLYDNGLRHERGNDQRILQWDWTRRATGHNQLKCYLSSTISIHKIQEISWFLQEILMVK